MRFMMMMISKGHEPVAPGAVRSAETSARMMEYNKSLQKAGVLLALVEPLPLSTGARLTYIDGKITVTDDLSGETEEVISGYWIIQVRSREEAIEWARRAPMLGDGVIEVRQLHEMGESPEDIRDTPTGFEYA